MLGAMSTVFWGMGGVLIRSVGNFMTADLEVELETKCM